MIDLDELERLDKAASEQRGDVESYAAAILDAAPQLIALARAARAAESLLRDVVSDLEHPEQKVLPPWKADLLRRASEALVAFDRAAEGVKPCGK